MELWLEVLQQQVLLLGIQKMFLERWVPFLAGQPWAGLLPKKEQIWLWDFTSSTVWMWTSSFWIGGNGSKDEVSTLEHATITRFRVLKHRWTLTFFHSQYEADLSQCNFHRLLCSGMNWLSSASKIGVAHLREWLKLTEENTDSNLCTAQSCQSQILSL